MERLTPSAVRYVRLGPAGAWLDRCISEGTIELGLGRAPHELAAAGHWDVIETTLVQAEGWCAPMAQEAIEDLRDFYELGEDCLWITFGRGRLWWSIAQAEVLPVLSPGRGARLRRLIGGWRDTDLVGAPLELKTLPPELLAPLAQRLAISRVGLQSQLIGRISAEPDPLTLDAQAALERLHDLVSVVVRRMEDTNLSALVEQVLSGLGWRRRFAMSGPSQSQALVLERDGERALAVIVGRSGPCGVDAFVRQAREFHYERLYLVGLEPRGRISALADPRVTVWGPEELAQRAIDAGLAGRLAGWSA